MAIGNGELMQKCFSKHSRVRTARMKYDKETDEEGKKKGVSVERHKAGTKEKSSDGPTIARAYRPCEVAT